MVIMFDTLADRARPVLHRQMLEEAAGQPLPELREDGWMSFGAMHDGVHLDREQINRQAELYYYTSPVARHLVRLNNAYTFSRGVSVQANDPDIDSWVDTFWRDPRNRRTLSTARAQWGLSRDLQLRGELFFIFYTSTVTGRVVVRTIKPALIEKVVYSPNDPEMPAGYIYRQPGKDPIVIPDITNADATMQLWSANNTEVHMLHVVSESYNGRGLSELATVIPWLKALKGFMEDRATLTLALATFAFKHKIKGNRQAVSRVAQQWGAYDTQMRYDGGRERRQGANTIIANEGSDLEQLKTDSGASNAYQDMRMFRQQAGIGMGIFEHYLGDPSTGNLATATAMELPMQKGFEYQQQFWSDVLTDLLSFVIMQGVRFGVLTGKGMATIDNANNVPVWIVEPSGDTDLNVTATFPPIVQRDIALHMSALSQVAQAEAMTGQQIIPPEQKMQTALRVLGYTHEASSIVEEWRANNFTLPTITPQTPAAQEAVKKLMNKLKEADPKDVGKPLPKSEVEKVEPLSQDEITQATADFADMPTLEQLAKELGLSVEDLDNA